MKHIQGKSVQAGVFAVVLIVALGSAGITWRNHVAADRWRAALEGVQAVELRLVSDAPERPALWGATTNEEADPHYDRALALVAHWDVDAVITAVRAEDDAARAERARFVEEGAEALEALHRGAHAARATRRVDWSLGFELPMRKLMHARFLMHLSEMRADLLFEQGQETEAVGVLLDALQFGGDLAQGPLLIEQMVGTALLSPDSLVRGVADGTLAALPEEAHERLVTGLRTLDRRLRWEMDFEGELVLGARGLERALGDDGDGLGELHPTWTMGLDRARGRSLAAEHVQTMEHLCAAYDRAFQSGPDELLAEFARTSEEFEALENPISALALPKFDSACRGRLYSLGRFRLLVHALSAEDAPLDPWLASYRKEEELEQGTRLWLDHPAFGELEVIAAP